MHPLCSLAAKCAVHFQRAATTARTRRIVTACLYLIFNCKARSRSTLITVSVASETLHRNVPVTYETIAAAVQIWKRSATKDIW
ncbi:hypothetical protein pdam_00000186 [Pocillopora damicornis]|uniref:Uncharacterized protein n=1 Tax=Pocillopora damicornis TaxID=46731 RepID=A0A3M6UWU7_POCDA|nr:hypothetical protein pdam_00000186 [Pocillopora damicornis]